LSSLGRVTDFLTSQYWSSSDDGKTLFLLSGLDKKIHIFKKDTKCAYAELLEVDVLFPQLLNLTSSVLQITTYHAPPYSILIYGTQNGLLSLHVSELGKPERVYQVHLEGPISVVHPFQLKTLRGDDAHPSVESIPSSNLRTENTLCLLVAGAVGYALVYSNIETCGLQEWEFLENSDTYDSVLCGIAADIDCDGFQEILIGTYGQELLAYKWCPPCGVATEREFPLSSQAQNSAHFFRLLWHRRYREPIYHITSYDLTGDGLCELAITTMNSCNIMQVLSTVPSFHIRILFLQWCCGYHTRWMRILFVSMFCGDCRWWRK